MPGKVYLVGAGPGDPELLTRRAWRVLQSTDVVLHDDLVSEEILRVLPLAAQVVNVGKRCGAKGISQIEINALMVSLARQGKLVARLKNGDPLLFGRAGEEMDALRQAEIEFEEVAGDLQAAGIGAEIPCVVISRATTKDETIFRTTVGKLAQLPGPVAPSLLVVGSVAGVPIGKDAENEVLWKEFRSQILSLAMEHPIHNSYGRGGVE